MFKLNFIYTIPFFFSVFVALCSSFKNSDAPPKAKDTHPLGEAYVTCATPEHADGKEGNDSYVDIQLFVTTDRGHYIGKIALRDNTGIGPNNAIFPHIDFKSFNRNFDNSLISYENLISIDSVRVDYIKHNQTATDHDVWNARFEVVLKFTEALYLVRGFNDPVITLDFIYKTRRWYPFGLNPKFPDQQNLSVPTRTFKKDLLPAPKLATGKPPIHIG